MYMYIHTYNCMYIVCISGGNYMCWHVGPPPCVGTPSSGEQAGRWELHLPTRLATLHPHDVFRRAGGGCGRRARPEAAGRRGRDAALKGGGCGRRARPEAAGDGCRCRCRHRCGREEDGRRVGAGVGAARRRLMLPVAGAAELRRASRPAGHPSLGPPPLPGPHELRHRVHGAPIDR